MSPKNEALSLGEENARLQAQVAELEKRLDSLHQQLSAADILDQPWNNNGSPSKDIRRNSTGAWSYGQWILRRFHLQTMPADGTHTDNDHYDIGIRDHRSNSVERNVTLSAGGLHHRHLSGIANRPSHLTESPSSSSPLPPLGLPLKLLKVKLSDIEQGSDKLRHGTKSSLEDDDDDDESLLMKGPISRIGSEDDKDGEKNSFLHVLSDRAGWLVGLLILQSCSSFILTRNEKLLQSHLVIVRFLTMLVGAGGNAGNQASVRVIRGLAIGTVRNDNVKAYLLTELKMALFLSLILGMAGCIRAAVFLIPLVETLAITASLLLIVMISIIIGATLPLAMKYVRIDPAHSSTTIQVLMDILGVTITVYVCGGILDSQFGKWLSTRS